MITWTPQRAHLGSEQIAEVAIQWHQQACMPGSKPDHRWSGDHLEQDRKIAAAMLEGMAGRGWHVCPLDFLTRVAS